MYDGIITEIGGLKAYSGYCAFTPFIFRAEFETAALIQSILNLRCQKQSPDSAQPNGAQLTHGMIPSHLRSQIAAGCDLEASIDRKTALLSEQLWVYSSLKS